MTFREFTGRNVEEAIRAAMAEFSSDLGDLDIEILAQGSRGILGVGGEEARILAAPKSAVAAAETIRPEPEAEPLSPAARDAAADEAAAVSAGEAAAAEATGPVAIQDAGLTTDQVAELARASEGRRQRGGRGGRGTRGGRNGRDRDRAREPRGIREPRADRPAREPSPFVPAKPLEELTEKERAILEDARSVLQEMLRLMQLESTVELALDGETARLNVSGDDLGVLIGRRGETLASLQHLVNLIVAKREGQHNRVAVDVENYRGRREQQLRDVAERAAARVTQSGKIIQLEAMPAMERRIVHMALVTNGSVRTQSVGVEPNRRIVILPAGQAKE